MTTLRLTFPAARYHATPWGRHVNEGVAEWPPSPYRLLRALYDVWQRKCYDLPEKEVETGLRLLASRLPVFTLPKAVATHTRSYLSANSKDPTDKNLVFDSFLVFDRPQACFLTWKDVDLPISAAAALNRLLANLNYLGRSESWVQAELWQGEVNGDFVCDALGQSEAAGEVLPVACAIPAAEYSDERHWMKALTFSTSNLIKERASSPPLLRQVKYVRPERAVETDPPRRRMALNKPAIQAILLGLDATVLPLVTATLEIGEQIRVRLMGAHKKINKGDASQVSPLFSGKGPGGGKRLDHGHVYILPQGNALGRIDRVLLLSRLSPFTADELNAVRCVTELYQPDGRPAARCITTWQGSPESSAVRQPSRVVVSATPFILARHWRKGRDFEAFIKEEVRRECLNHRILEPSLADAIEVELLPWLPNVDNSASRGLFDIVEYRRNRKNDPVRPGFSLRLTFSQPVLTPFALGYGAHFGLGQFRAAD